MIFNKNSNHGIQEDVSVKCLLPKCKDLRRDPESPCEEPDLERTRVISYWKGRDGQIPGAQGTASLPSVSSKFNERFRLIKETGEQLIDTRHLGPAYTHTCMCKTETHT